MLDITVPETELFNEETQEFVYIPKKTLRLEHSLISMSKWESKYCKAFMSKNPLTQEEFLYYVKCMTVTQNVDPSVYLGITPALLEEIKQYIGSPMTATRFRDDGRRGGTGEAITSELVYYWMVSLQIPFECQRWHLNRLLTLIRVCNAKNAPAKKMNRNSIYSQNAALNAARRKSMHSRG